MVSIELSLCCRFRNFTSSHSRFWVVAFKGFFFLFFSLIYDISFLMHLQVVGLQGGALLGVTYKMPRRQSTTNMGLSAAAGTIDYSDDPSISTGKTTEAPANFQLYRYFLLFIRVEDSCS